ncbi:cell wall hydrolase [Paenibacillus sp. GCM10023252]|uniref:cell wall hydrolase n=1 Tax=Paenibacillus sp. GCM10023252 TaxID=3252649 RepID=UPI00361648EB
MKKLLIVFTLLITAYAGTESHTAEAATTLKPGTSGTEVQDLQFRLQTLKYFPYGTTAYYGEVTKSAVSKFQAKHGLTSDGIAGPQTLSKLNKVSLNKSDVTKLARIIYAEARGETYPGQVAIGAVVLNRMQSPLFPKTVSSVLTQPNAFTAMKNGQFWLNPNGKAYDAAKDAVRGSDPSKNAYYFYNPAATSSAWFESRVTTAKIGNHVFKR